MIFVYFSASKINHTYVRLQELLAELGLTVSSKQLVAPSTQVTCLGIVVSSIDFTISIPEKLEIIKTMCIFVYEKQLYKERLAITFRFTFVCGQMYQRF